MGEGGQPEEERRMRRDERLPGPQFPSMWVLMPDPPHLSGTSRGAEVSVKCGRSPLPDFAKGEEIHPREAICL